MTIGHNVGGIDAGHLKSFIERIERLHEEREQLAADVKDVFAEAKGSGFDVKIMRKILQMRRKDKAALDEEETLIELYKNALGMA